METPIPFLKKVQSDYNIRIPQHVSRDERIEHGDIVEVQIKKGPEETHLTLPVGRWGELYIPREAREALNIQKGDILETEIQNILRREVRKK